MLDLSALTQLKQLKKDIRDANPILKGVVKGTSKRFGFVVTEGSNEQYLLPQAEMNLVLPGDTITFTLQKGTSADEKPIAKIEKFIDCSFEHFIGKIKVKNNQFYVIPDHKQINRWIFIPPKSRKELKDGDLVSAKISQHPFKSNGRVQAQILDRIGQPDDPFIEHRYAIVKFGIQDRQWKPEEIEAIRQTAEQCLEEAIPQKTDLTHETFFTIDGANTQDLDDALAIESCDDGWHLKVAISDVETFVTPNSPLDKIAASQASTVYLPGQKVSMLPDILASDICSLRSNVDRLALICNMKINTQGDVLETWYENAVIHPKGKLCYEKVDAFLQGKSEGFDQPINDSLKKLAELTKARQQWRLNNATVMDDFCDYRYQLDENGKIIHIEKSDRNLAQKLVEECMIACNFATAQFLSQHTQHALYLSHNGFKQDQKPGVRKLLSQHYSDVANDDIFELKGYLDFISSEDHKSVDLPIKDILRKKMNRSEWTTNASPHFGLGFNSYTTFTSPIRKYSDLLVHRMVKAIINNNPLDILNDTELKHLNSANQAVRDTQRDCETSLKCEYLKQFKSKPLAGYISAINHRFISVFLSDFDLHGQIPVKTFGKNAKFRQESLQLITEDKSFQLKQDIEVMIDEIDKEERTIKLKLAAADAAPKVSNE